MSETQPSQNNLEIYFHESKADDITIWFDQSLDPDNRYTDVWKCRIIWEKNGYHKVRVFYNCNGLQIIGEGKTNGEMFIPATSINHFAVDYPEGHKFDRA